jgi:hypothetical protein
MYRNHRKPGSRIYRACRTAVDMYVNLEKLAALRYCYDLGGCVTVKIASIQGSRRLAFCSATVQEQEVNLIHQSARGYLLRKENDGDAALEAF